MRYLYVVMALVIVSCGPKKDESILPEDLVELKKLKTEKRTEFRALQKYMARIDSLIEVKDPDSKIIEYKLVTVDTIERLDFDRFLEVQSNVEADDELMVSSEIGGRIISSFVKEGQYVSRGALVAKLDMESVSKQKAEIKKTLELANQVYEKQSRLWAKKIGSEIQYLEAKNNKERLEKSLETIDFQLTKANVYAPMSGEVEMVFAESGETVAPGAPIIKILSTRNLKVVAEVPEKLIRAVKRGDKVTIKIPALDYEKQLRVSRIGSTISPANRTFKVEVNVANPKGDIKPNLLALMLINDYHEDDAIAVPINLIKQEVGGNDFIYVAEKQDTNYIAKKISVVQGESFDGMVVIKEGLEENDWIIANGSSSIREDQYIKIINTD